jgi:hypothetical protein
MPDNNSSSFDNSGTVERFDYNNYKNKDNNNNPTHNGIIEEGRRAVNSLPQDSQTR